MAAVCRALMPQYSIDCNQCQVDWGWDGSAGTVDEFDDWPIVLAVDWVCKRMNRKSMVALLSVKGAVQQGGCHPKGTVCTVHTVGADDGSVIFACILFWSSLVFYVPSSPGLLFPIFVFFSFCFTATFISLCFYKCSSIQHLCLYSSPPQTFLIIFIFPENRVFCLTVIEQYLLPRSPPLISFFVFFLAFTPYLIFPLHPFLSFLAFVYQ